MRQSTTERGLPSDYVPELADRAWPRQIEPQPNGCRIDMRPPARHRKPREADSALTRRRAWAGRLFIAPNLLAVLVFMLFPLGFSLYVSFHTWDLFGAPRYVGLQNYRRLLTTDPMFYVALRNTVAFTVMTVVPTAVISLGCAAALNRVLKGIGIFRTIMFLPLVASSVGMALMWRFLFATDHGLVNILLGHLGVHPIGWLTEPRWALVALSAVTIWKSVPFATIILLAALQTVPTTVHEAAKLDGAGGFRRFRSVTLPLIRPALSFVLVITIINSFQAFDQAYVLTGGSGGPETGTYVFGIMLFQNAFGFYKVGYASALAWVVFVILLALTALQLRIARRESTDQ